MISGQIVQLDSLDQVDVSLHSEHDDGDRYRITIMDFSDFGSRLEIIGPAEKLLELARSIRRVVPEPTKAEQRIAA